MELTQQTQAESGELTPELREMATHIEGVARSKGLDFFPIVFLLLDASNVNGVAAYGGFPVRYPSWRFGMDFERLEKGYQYGFSKIYELVINNDPVYAYLVRSNSELEQKLVMAHVCGHADFFKHNCWFQSTDRGMVNTMGSHSTRVRQYIDTYGLERVESFLDQALSLDTLIDPYLSLRKGLRPLRKAGSDEGGGADSEGEDGSAESKQASNFRATYDILGHLANHAPVEDWQRDILRMVRAEAYYFQPQRMTKIINEGWASFWHSRLLTGGLLDPSEIIDFADCHSGATAQSPGQLNPYKLGIELFRYAEEQGLDLFELRRVHNDASFIDALFDERFCEQNSLFVYGKNPRTGRVELLDRDWRKVKRNLLQSLSWGGLPQLELIDVNAEGEGELTLLHHHDGRDLQLAQAAETMKGLELMWNAPVHLLTKEDGQGRKLVCNRGEIQQLESPESLAS